MLNMEHMLQIAAFGKHEVKCYGRRENCDSVVVIGHNGSLTYIIITPESEPPNEIIAMSSLQPLW